MNNTLLGPRSNLAGAIAIAAMACLTGCSDQAPVTRTPDYHVGTPTNRSSVMSWELNHEPFYTQPGVNSGQQVPTPPTTASQRGFEPYDSVAGRVYTAIAAARINAKYISATAKNGNVVLIGSVDTEDQLKKTVDIAQHVQGVRQVRSELTVAQPAVAKD
jgi:hypothetical protein